MYTESMKVTAHSGREVRRMETMSIRNTVAVFQDELNKSNDVVLMLMIGEATKMKRSTKETERGFGELLMLQCERAAFERGW
jgi:hypothetical protein